MDRKPIHQPQKVPNSRDDAVKTCSLSEKDRENIRKHYYQGKVSEYMDKRCAKGEITEEEAKSIFSYLEELEKERKKLQSISKKFDLIGQVDLPSVQEIMSIDGGKHKKILEWEEEMKKKYTEVQKMFQEIKKVDNSSNVDKYLDWGFELTRQQYFLDNYRVWKDQLYRAKIVEFIDLYKCSRAEAEERAKLSEEYRDYKKAVLHRDLVEEVIMLCKKKHSKFN